jgi:hypothetical protein
VWRAWGRWRRSRPFWSGLLIVLGGTEILVSERAPVRVILHLGVQGIAGYLLPIVIILCGFLLWFNPQQRLFYSILAVIMSLGTWVTSNLGGFFLGLILGVVGGSLAFGWTPDEGARRGGPLRAVSGWIRGSRPRPG